MNITKLFLLLSIATCLAACKQTPSTVTNSQPTKSAAVVNPCTVITPQEIAEVLGQQVKEGECCERFPGLIAITQLAKVL